MQGAIVTPFKPVRTLLRQMIEAVEPGMDVIEASDTDSVEAIVRKHAPAIIFTNLPAATDGGFERMERIKSAFPDLILVVMVRYDFPEYAMMSEPLGIDAIISEENMSRHCIRQIVDKAIARCSQTGSDACTPQTVTTDTGGVAMRELVNQIAQALVDDPHNVTVSEIGSSRTTVLELKVAKPDVGKVIGRHGRTASALRTIINAVSSKTNQRTILEILE